MSEKTVEKMNVRALSQGVNLTKLRESLPELEAACNRKIEAQEDYKNTVQVVALQIGIMPAVLSQYVQSRVTDTVRKKQRSAEQLSLLFSEFE